MSALFRPKALVLIFSGEVTYEYYLGADEIGLSLIEEKPTLRIVDLPVISYRIEPIPEVNFEIPLNNQDNLVFQIGSHHLTLGQLHATGGEARIYKGTFDGLPVVYKTYIRSSDKLRALPAQLGEYLPRKYLLFKYLSKGYFVAMEQLQELVYSQKIFQQALEFLNLLEQLGEVHGDISPGNLMQDASGNLKVIDFARPLSRGTPFYNEGKTDRQGMARSLLGYKYFPDSRLGVVYRKSKMNETQFFDWLSSLPQDNESQFLIAMAR